MTPTHPCEPSGPTRSQPEPIRARTRRGSILVQGVSALALAGAALAGSAWVVHGGAPYRAPGDLVPPASVPPGQGPEDSKGQDSNAPSSGAQDPAARGADDTALTAAFAAAGVQVDPAAGALAFPVSVEVRGEALEYLLVNPHGAVHESLFVTEVDAEVLATAFLAVGAEPGKNVQYVERVPPPTREEIRAGARTHDVIPPSGKPLYFYAVWREAAGAPDPDTGRYTEESTYFHRIEELVLDLERDRTLRRHGWVWLGSRMVEGEGDGAPARFAAQATGNLAAVTFFAQGDTLFTAALPECVSQTNWFPNGWLLPQPGAQILLIASLAPIDEVPGAFGSAVPMVAEPDPDAAPQRRR